MKSQMRERLEILTGTARVTCLFSALAGICACAQTLEQAQPDCPGAPPAFPSTTFDENDRYLANPKCRTEPLDRLKYIPLRGENEDYTSLLAYGFASVANTSAIQTGGAGRPETHILCSVITGIRI